MTDRKPNAYCEVCGERYYRCLACEKIGSWKLYCDTPEHFQVFMVLSEYKLHHDPSLAREQLGHIGFKYDGGDNYVPQVRRILSEIFEESIPQG